MMTKDEYLKEERKQTIHRSANTLLMVLVLVLGFFFVRSEVTPVYERLTGIEQQRQIQTEIEQIVKDEGYRRCVYNDSLGLPTIGFGHLMTISNVLTHTMQ